MVVKFCIVSRDRDEILCFFNVDLDNYRSLFDVNTAVKNRVCSICNELNLSFSQVDVFEQYVFFD